MNDDYLLKLTKAQLIKMIRDKEKRIQELECENLIMIIGGNYGRE